MELKQKTIIQCMRIKLDCAIIAVKSAQNDQQSNIE
jgi:hypothetical protein